MRVLSSIVILLLVLISAVTAAPSCDSFSYVNRVDVSNDAELNTAVTAAQPGDLIVLADGTYNRAYTIRASGTEALPIVMCGTKNAIITTAQISTGNTALRFVSANYWTLVGFTISTAKKGLEIETSNYFVVDDVTVENIGNQCVYIKTQSSYNVIKNSRIHGCGVAGASGKGIYIGTSSAPYSDASNFNVISDTIISNTIAENVDIREGSIGNQLLRNTFSGDEVAQSIGQIVAVRGNNGLIVNNTFANAPYKFKYGLRTSTNGEVWGNYNIFRGNYFDLVDISDEALYIHNPSTFGNGNVVYCSNSISSSTSKFTNAAGGCVADTHEEEPTVPPTPPPTLPPTPPPAYDFVTPSRPSSSSPYRTCDSFTGLRRVLVSNATALHSALADATAGDVIVLADGLYIGNFLSERAVGSESNPIVLCGSNNAILSTNTVSTGSALEIHFASHWYLSGFKIFFSKKGLQFETVQYSVIDGLFFDWIGEEAVHIKLNSSYNTIKHSIISNTGRLVNRTGYGEGVYVGTAVNNGRWDLSDYNQILFNYIGPNVTAEGADIKEYTTGTYVFGNIFNGIGLSGANSAETLLAVKGNYGLVKNNTFYHTRQHATRTSYLEGWGNFNVYDGNFAYVPEATGVGYYIHHPNTFGAGNVLLCNNWVYGTTTYTNSKCVDSLPVPPSVPSEDTCSEQLTFTHTLTNTWSDGKFDYSQFSVVISNSLSLHSLNFRASFEIFSNLIKKTDGSYLLDIQDGDYILSGASYKFSYVVRGKEATAIKVLSGNCTAPVNDCKVIVSQKRINSWSDSQNSYFQFGFDFTNNGDKSVDSLDLTLLLPTGATPTGAWNLITSDSQSSILSSSRVHYSASLWGLSPSSSHRLAHGYTLVLPLASVISDPLFEVSSCL